MKTDQHYIEEARVKYVPRGEVNDIEIDDKPEVSRGEGGAFVAAWVWVPDGIEYEYHINLDERGGFDADVRDPLTEKSVYFISVGYNDEDSTIFEDGFMKHKDDMDGLTEYLKSLNILGPEDTIINCH